MQQPTTTTTTLTPTLTQPAKRRWYDHHFYCDSCKKWILQKTAVWKKLPYQKNPSDKLVPTCPEPTCNNNKLKTRSKHYKPEIYQKTKKAKDGTHRHIAGRPYYDDRYGTGLCPTCNNIWQLHEQIMYTTENGNRTYGICPECKIKHPLRKKPRTTRGYKERFPPKRIE